MSLFITVGSTGFDDLIRQTTRTQFLNSLTKVGIKKVVYQYGSSEQVFSDNLQSYDGKVLDIDGYKYKPSITEDMEWADIIISHAGAGNILQALRMKNKKLIVVVNMTLMDNHQYQLAQAMQAYNYAICSDLSELTNTLQNIHNIKLTPFPAAKPAAFATVVDEQMGFAFNHVYTQSITTQLSNNQIVSSSVAINGYNYYYFSVSATGQLFSKRDLPTIHLSTSICNQPTAPADFHDTVPPLNLYISTSSSNTLPGPNNSATVDSEYGLIKWTSDNQTSEIWIAVAAPALTGAWNGNFTYEIGVSTSQTMHPIFVNNEKSDNSNIPYVILDDTDRNNALFLSSPIQSNTQNSSLLVTTAIPVELSWSLCAAKQRTLSHLNVNTTTTHRGPTNSLRRQFMVSNLTQDTSYTAYMLQPVGSVTGMTTPVNLGTKIDANCRIIYDLPFCDQVAYSVPTDLSSFAANDLWTLAHEYDAQAQDKFEPFNTALSQYNCDTTQYSLVRNCTDCYRDYKTWLCAVTIPRCTDSSASADLSQGTDDVPAAPALRDISANASRNPWIDETLKPGEWTELLPCIDLCYHVVQSCPPFMQFYCPDSDLALVQYGYWQNGTASVNGTTFHFDIHNPTCNRMGVDPALLTLGSASRLYSPYLLTILCITSVFFLI